MLNFGPIARAVFYFKISIVFAILRLNLSRRFGRKRTNASLGDLARNASRNLRQSGQLELICEHNNHDCPDAFHLVVGHACSLVFALLSECPGTVLREPPLATIVASVSHAVEELVEMAAWWRRPPLWEDEAEDNGH